MANHTISIPNHRDGAYCIQWDDTIKVKLKEPVSLSYTQNPASPPAFSPALPSGPQPAGTLGPYTAQHVNAVLTVTYIRANGDTGQVTITVMSKCP